MSFEASVSPSFTNECLYWTSTRYLVQQQQTSKPVLNKQQGWKDSRDLIGYLGFASCVEDETEACHGGLTAVETD